jgi:hypothetical protein
MQQPLTKVEEHPNTYILKNTLVRKKKVPVSFRMKLKQEPENEQFLLKTMQPKLFFLYVS